MELKDRKDIATTFLRLCATGKVEEAYGLVSRDFRHHNPYFRGDAASLKAGMADAAAKFPRTSIQTQRAVEQMHIFRFKGGQIAELWDIATEEPENSPNENGMF